MSKSPKTGANRRIAGISALIAVIGAVGAVGAVHAETQLEPVAASVAMVAPQAIAGQRAAPVFTPSEEAQFADTFAPYDDPAHPLARPGTVDITAIEPAEPVATVLGDRMASYYGRRFHGRLTANGERFDMNALTAAHKTLPFGTQLRVTYPRTGRSVVVRVNDRGPFVSGRDLDLSRAAAEKIGLVQQGHGRVEVELLAG